MAAATEQLPVVLVTAADDAAARLFAAELIGEDGEDGSGEDASMRVWHLQNKYYSARVCVCAVGGAAEGAGAEGGARWRAARGRVHAHVLLLRPHEGIAELRARIADDTALPACAVRLAVGAGDEPLLAADARDCGYEPVAMAAAAGDAGDGGDGDGPEGMERVREALHAHVWPGLSMHPPADGHVAGDHDDDEWQWSSFAGALGSLGAARAAVAQAGLPREQRLQRAEALLAAFCQALAEHPDPDDGDAHHDANPTR